MCVYHPGSPTQVSLGRGTADVGRFEAEHPYCCGPQRVGTCAICYATRYPGEWHSIGNICENLPFSLEIYPLPQTFRIGAES